MLHFYSKQLHALHGSALDANYLHIQWVMISTLFFLVSCLMRMVVHRSNQPTEILLKNLDTNIQNIEKFQNSSDFSGIGKYGSIRIAISAITPFRDALDLMFSQLHSFKLLFWLLLSLKFVSPINCDMGKWA